MASNNDLPSGGFAAAFKDFDLDDVFKEAEQRVVDKLSKNFVVEFGYDRARIAFDLGNEEIKELLERDPDPQKDYPIRWINVWDPSAQKDVMTSIVNRYGFSLRLLSLMTTPRPHQDETRRYKERKRAILRHQRLPIDPEKGDATNNFTAKPVPSTEANDNLALYLQVKDTVNYSSTDQTQKAFCIGANWLHKRPRPEHGREHPRTSIMPPKHWQWLALCNNHTVLSIHERPSYELVPEKEDEKRWRQTELQYMRSHMLDILRQLSKKGYEQYKSDPLAQSSVRESLRKFQLGITRQESGVSIFNSETGSLADEGTSNLFYYLFEDYVAAGPLKAAEQELDEMTHKILESTHWKKVSKSSEIIPTLHYLSKDLREFKHLFENYKNLINKILSVGKPDSQPPPPLDVRFEVDRRVSLTSSALSRFTRLGDRLQYLMLNTIEGYLEEIGALSTTYFNLTQQKDSQATARLTRSATLLAKLSVFFLPISFMTSYFSVQIEDLYTAWTGNTYWYAFAVIASVSFVSLFFFSRLLMFSIDMLDDWAAKIATGTNKLLQTVLAWVAGLRSRNGGDGDT
ncbi:uncharacterized protein F4822DRAFT_412020 [Hypoxylon trugodes]|uniref:uncharacterized protein n=1 Tax=Hypoxylon trugodes TaxID=326681 RepID=UPI00219F8FD9|nr:uncharacterized protein F4822DRAFT_412020 [Hypoxylon trugodes]KAI1387074.1 hypothetical protein F4822DRAFT_412020 [Hypoxylon trugodes]